MLILDGNAALLMVRESMCCCADLQATFREKLEWLEEAEMLSLRFRANRDSHSNQELLPRL